MTNLWIVLLVVFVPLVMSKRPNIIVIIADDLGWNDVGYHGSNQIKTPNIDALAYSGMILNRHYVLPSCTPSRSAFLTGRHPIHTGMQGFPLKAGENRSLPLSLHLLPRLLRDLGYDTTLVGKWHLGYETEQHIPINRGFNNFLGIYNGYTDYYNYRTNQSLNGVTGKEGVVFSGNDLISFEKNYFPPAPGYATNLFTKTVIEKLENKPDKPKFVVLSHLAPHTGTDEPMGMQMPPDANVNASYPYIKDYGRRAFAGCLEELDRSVGLIMEKLKKENMLENSIVLFFSDNGAHSVSVDMSPNWGSNWPLSGTKFTNFEGGVRGAAIIWSPLLPKGVVNEGFLHITDWYPTLYAAAGGDVTRLGLTDGINQWEALRRGTALKRGSILLNIDEKIKAEAVIINERWKLVKGGFPKYANYDRAWGKEENSGPEPKYNISAVQYSNTAQAVESLPEYRYVLNTRDIKVLRDLSTVRCQPPENKIQHKEGFVPPSFDFRCSNYCLFDIKNDPCEKNDLKDTAIISMGAKILDLYRIGLVRQKPSGVDPKSNPKFFGAWLPWKTEVDEKPFVPGFINGCLRFMNLFATIM